MKKRKKWTNRALEQQEAEDNTAAAAAAATGERGRTCCLAAGVVIDEVTERPSSECTVSSEGQAEVGWRSECNQREDAVSQSPTRTEWVIF